jgi:trehalose synthase-fused probable maltokinase
MVRGGELRYRDTGDAAMRALGGTERPLIRAVGAEQSNTSVRVGGTLVFKLFRRLEDGENPELEIGRFLMTHTSFRAVPTLRGSLTYVPARGVPSTLGVLQDWVDNRGDGWSYVVGLLEQAGGSTGHTLLRDLFALGETTAECHAALSVDATVPAFAPEPVTGSDIEDWRASLLERLRSTMRFIERNLPAWPEDTRQLGRTLLDARIRAAALAQVPELRAASERFRKIRIHGDFHLGQTLKATDRFILLDFEGEPARPLAERRLKQCALKDVAGMIRSFDYAVETARRRGAKALPESLSAQHLRTSFLDGYLEAARRRDAVFVPRDGRALEPWIDFFELEKALYEVEYEINNRPDWVHIPLRGIVRMLGGQS